MRRLGLQRKFALALIGSGVFLILVLTGLWYSGNRANMELVRQTSEVMRDQSWSELQQRGEVTVRFLADTLPNLIYYYDLQGLRDTAVSALDQDDIRYVLIYDLEGRVLHDGTPALERFGEVMDDEFAAEAIATRQIAFQWSDAILDVSKPVMLGREPIGGVRIGLSTTEAEKAIAREQQAMTLRLRGMFIDQMRLLLLSFLLLLLAAGILSWLVSRGLVRPIRELAAAAQHLEQGHFDKASIASERADELGQLIQAFNRMAGSLRDQDQSIRELAYQDTLTGLPNRLMFRELLDEVITEYASSGQPLGLLFIDLDDFKRVNDTLGHDVGDEVLAEFASRLRACLDGEDDNHDRTLIARLGGDEFVALISGHDVSSRCRILADRIIETLRQPFELGERSLYLSTSIGITRFPEDAHNAKLLLKCGDLAMYQAKMRGKNCYSFFNDGLTVAADEQLLLEQDLREAMINGDLKLAYQPIVDIHSGQIVSAEALLRWQHSTRGSVSPEQFVAAAEASALIEELGAMTLHQACRDAAQWQARMPGLRVSVNISGRQLLKQGLQELAFSALDASGLPPECLTLELTESSLLHDQVLASESLASLRKRGVGIWLDDFGTGFSGLSHLRQVPVDGVKIDRSFIADMLTDADDLALTSAIIAMAHSIGMQVIGEGVESREQLKVLQQRDCDFAQGFLFGPAIPVDELINLFDQWHLSAS
jgi:diguanylate cyclase (GGDEF)-like protein